MHIKIPDYILLAINMLNSAGYKAYIVGGCVRDAILNKTPNDWDICTSALPEEVCKIFTNFNLVKSGIKHGTVCVIINHLPVEITTFRIDGNYKDNRRPENVTFSRSIEDDLKRRDFTINAMAYSKKDGIIDLNGGISDLNNKIIRCVGDPETRFKEDALRIMRGLRFGAQLGFVIEQNTKNAMIKQKNLLKNISAERITDEFTKLMMSENFLQILKEYESVVKVFLPSFTSNFPTKVIKEDLSLRLSYILSANKQTNMLECLKLPKKISFEVETILNNYEIKIDANRISLKKLLNIFGPYMLEKILYFKSLMGEDTKLSENLLKELILNKACYSVRQLKINGNDILNLGVKSNLVGHILNIILEEVINEKLDNDHNNLIENAKKIIKEHN